MIACAGTAQAQSGPVATSITYWGASEADRLKEFETFADKAVFLDGDGVNSANFGANILLEEMLLIAQASDDPGTMFRSDEFLRLLSIPAERFGYVDATEQFRKLLDLAVRQCPASAVDDACIAFRFKLASMWRATEDFDASLAVLEPVVQANPRSPDNASLNFLHDHVAELRTDFAGRANDPESDLRTKARAERLRQVTAKVLRALMRGDSDTARLALIGLPPAVSDDPTAGLRRMLAHLDGDKATFAALAGTEAAESDACDPTAWFYAHPDTSTLPASGLPGCDYSLKQQQSQLDAVWARAALWSPRDPKMANAASRFSARWISDLIGAIDRSIAEEQFPTSSYLPKSDIPIFSALVSVGLERDSAVPRAEADSIFRMLQAVNMGSLAQSIGLRIAEQRAAQVDPQVLPLIREYREMKQPLVIYGKNSSDAGSDNSQDRRVHNPVAEINRENELVAEINRRAPNYFSSALPRLYTLKETQALLGPKEALVVLSPAAQGTIAFAVTADRVAWASGEWDPAKVGRAVTRLRWDVFGTQDIPLEVEDRWIRDAGIEPSFNRKLAHEVYNELFGGIASALAGKDMLFVLTTGDLAALPMGILVTAPPQGEDNDMTALRDTPWMAEKMAIAAIPSIQMLDLLRSSDDAALGDLPEAILAGFGDPSLSRVKVERGVRSATGRARGVTRSATGTRQVASINDMIELPGTRVELMALKDALGAPDSSIRLASEATEAAVIASLSEKAGMMSFATHGVMPFEVDGINEGALILTPVNPADPTNDGILRSSEVAQMRLAADWVILSACNSGMTSGRTNAFMGLPEAFLFAGAKSLLVSHWPVLDDVAPVLTVRTVEIARDQKVGKAQALQLAMREVRTTADNPDWAHPAAWAPFELVSDGQ